MIFDYFKKKFTSFVLVNLFCSLISSSWASTALQKLETYDKGRISQWGERNQPQPRQKIETATQEGMTLLSGTHQDHLLNTNRSATPEEKDQLFSFLIRSALIASERDDPRFELKDFFPTLKTKTTQNISFLQRHQLSAYLIYRTVQLYEKERTAQLYLYEEPKQDLDQVALNTALSALAQQLHTELEGNLKQTAKSLLSSNHFRTFLNSGTKDFLTLIGEAKKRFVEEGLPVRSQGANKKLPPLVTWKMKSDDVHLINDALKKASEKKVLNKDVFDVVTKAIHRLELSDGAVVGGLLNWLENRVYYRDDHITSTKRSTVAEKAMAWFITPKSTIRTIESLPEVISSRISVFGKSTVDGLQRLKFAKDQQFIDPQKGDVNVDLIESLVETSTKFLSVGIPLIKNYFVNASEESWATIV